MAYPDRSLEILLSGVRTLCNPSSTLVGMEMTDRNIVPFELHTERIIDSQNGELLQDNVRQLWETGTHKNISRPLLTSLYIETKLKGVLLDQVAKAFGVFLSVNPGAIRNISEEVFVNMHDYSFGFNSVLDLMPLVDDYLRFPNLTFRELNLHNI